MTTTEGAARHIALVGPFLPYRGGIAEFSEKLAAACESKGWGVTRVSFSRQYPRLFFPGQSEYEPGSEAHPGTFRLIDSINPLSWGRTSSLLRQAQPQAVLFQYWIPAFAFQFSRIAKNLKRAGIPSYALVHNAFPHERWRFNRQLAQPFFNACEGAVSLSSAVTKDLAQLAPGLPVTQGFHPLYDYGAATEKDSAREKLNLPRNAPLFLFSGLIRRYKGLRVLLDAWPAVLSQQPDAQLVIAGECYEDYTQYQQQIDALGIGASVHSHTRYIEREQVAAYFSAADAVVLPYLSATQSGVAKTAFFYERPIVTTDVGGLADIVPHDEAGLVIPPNDPSALGDALVQVLDAERHQKLVKGIQALKPRYAWPALVDRIDAMLNSK